MTDKTKLPEPEPESELSRLTDGDSGDMLMTHDDDFLANLQEAALKTEGGQRFPAAAYAFVPDPEKPSDWKLRIWETLDKKVTVRQLGRAAAAFSPGGFRGQRVKIPSGDVATVKAKLRAAYRRIGIESADIPASLRESDKTIPHWIEEREPMERFKTHTVLPLEEGAYNAAKGELLVTIIRPGFNTSKSRYYTKDAIRETGHIFSGAKMFVNHQTKAEEAARPEGDFRKWAGNLGETFVAEDGSLKAPAKVVDPDLKAKLALAADAGLLHEVGASIRAIGKGTKSIVEGVKTYLVEQFVNRRSVDIVTSAGAGGQVECFESDEGDENDVDLIDEAALRERRPDLVELIEAQASQAKSKETEGDTMPEDKVAEIQAKLEEAETQLKESKGTNEALATERDDLKGKLEEAQGKEARAEAQKEISEAIANAEGLPKLAKERLAQHFVEADTADGIAKAIEAEAKYLADLSEAGSVQNLGETNEDDEKDGTAKLIESIKQSHIRKGMKPEAAEEAAKVSVGRR